jgi:UDP-N-acetylmuramoyl-L-alanyl-D-glutamate--2,6-diaminopimelate ligase
VRLGELAAAVGARAEQGAAVEIRRVVHDSRQAGAGDLFVAVRGLHVDGHDFAAAAAAQGAAVAVERPVDVPAEAPRLRVPDTRAGLAELSAALHGRPGRDLAMVGVTGTSGKTTTTHLIAHTLEQAGHPAGFLSTVSVQAGGRSQDNPSGRTTMESSEVQEWLARIRDGGARAAVVESTSHALDQGRVAACEFDIGAVTNVGSDHLDYHGTRERYVRAKARLLELCAGAAHKGVPKTAVLNRDDRSFGELAAYPIARRMTYAIDHDADVRAVDLARLEGGGTAFGLRTPAGTAPVTLQLPGRFNVSNALCAATCCLALGLTAGEVAAGLASFGGVRGRLQPVDAGQPFQVLVDFASTAHELSTVLPQVRELLAGRLIVVVGPTGRSDHDRPRMGRAVAEHADFFVITTDDPVGEDPAELARQMETGAQGQRRGVDYEIELDRAAAIRRALAAAEAGDTVLLAGKGHERTLLLAGGPVPWDDHSEAEAAMRALGLGRASG